MAGQRPRRREPSSGAFTHDGAMSNGIGVVFILLLSWGVPILLVIYLFRTLGTIVEGSVRSMRRRNG
jgi:hypothetical protein